MDYALVTGALLSDWVSLRARQSEGVAMTHELARYH
jgi:hypothetical protein